MARALAIVGLLMLAVFGGLYYPAQFHLDLALAGVLLGGGSLALIRTFQAPFWGLAVLLVAGVLTPLQLGERMDICLVLAATSCGMWVIRPIVLRRRLGLEFSPVVVALLAFLSLAVLSFLVGQYPWFPTDPAPMRAQVGGLALFMVSGGLFLAVGHQIRSIVHLERLTWLFIGAGGVFVAMQLAPWLPGASTVSAISNPSTVGSMFWVWLVAVSFSQALCNAQLPRPMRVLALLIGTLTLARGLLLAFSWASGWLPPLIALSVVLLLRFPRFAAGAGLLAVVPAVFVSARVLDMVMDSESYSWMTRLQAWSVMLQVVERNPLLGYGPANYYHYTLLFPILGWWVRFNSHNNYMDLLGQTGFLGLLAFFWFAYQAGRLALRLWFRAPVGFPRAYAGGALAGLAGSLVAGFLADWIIPFAYNIGLKGFRSSLLFWFFLGGSLALHRMLAPGRKPAAAPRTTPTWRHIDRPRLRPATPSGLQPAGEQI